MAKTMLSSITLLLLALTYVLIPQTHPLPFKVLTQPRTPTTALYTAPPFNLLVFPNSPTPTGTATPLYLTSTGSTTTTRSQGAVCWLSPASDLYCGNFKVAIGFVSLSTFPPSPLNLPPIFYKFSLPNGRRVPSSTQATKITACTATTGCETSGWKINSTDFGLSWSDAGFVWRESDGSAWAVFENGGVEGEGVVGARLKASFS